MEDLNELATANGAIHHRMELPFKNITDAAEQMKNSGAALQSRLPGIDESTRSTKSNRFLVDDHVQFEAPLGSTAWALVSNMIHRGQLSTCIRPMGGKHPDIYGPSGDSSPQ